MNYRGGVEIPSGVSKSNRTLSLLYARAILEKIGTNEQRTKKDTQ